tara:strand:- start:1180 stop:1374 length:195 start_codon:yes stop_codon:yes gene_type:complete
MYLPMGFIVRATFSDYSDIRVVLTYSLHDVIVENVEGSAFAAFSDNHDVLDTSGVIGCLAGFSG